MRKLLLYGLTICGFGLFLSSCMPKDDNIYNGPSVVEFKNHLLGKVNLPSGVSGNGELSRTESVNTRGTDTIYVQLVGPQRPNPIDIGFAVNGTSTAVEGTHYKFKPAGARKVTIPANSSVGYILIDLVPGSVAAGATFPLSLSLTGTDDVKPSANYKNFVLTLSN
ncbi:hypothetical protein [Pedobacter nutrimenti]|jgi:hypothetical protein|uniref:DUF4843 domain-containing protein n=1 Tax=Pedobacter nutrimenti TaxID=1241337 RepID=A0A318UNM2_9SPHI|nr:hypothetical protein [Pedobacter nutrimenti]PYF77331.1 hypothetical protein B0O44_101812 [Pedobacter nutrimenti]